MSTNLACALMEYAFREHEQSSTGVFEVEPRCCPGFTFRKSILIGRNDLEPHQVRTFMEKLSKYYHGNTYNLIAKNCNHYCNDACLCLTDRPIPSWVNRLARLGVLCHCVLPASLNARRVEEEEKKVGSTNRSRSNRFAGAGAVAETPIFRRSKSSSNRCSPSVKVNLKMMMREVKGTKW